MDPVHCLFRSEQLVLTKLLGAVMEILTALGPQQSVVARNRLDLEEYAAQTAFGVGVVTSAIFTAFAGRLAQRMPRAAPEQALYVCVEIAWLLKHLAFLLRLVVRRLVQVSSLHNFKV